MPKASAKEWVIAVFAVGLIVAGYVAAIVGARDQYQLEPGERVTVPRAEAERYECGGGSYARVTFARPNDMTLVWCAAPDEPCCLLDEALHPPGRQRHLLLVLRRSVRLR